MATISVETLVPSPVAATWSDLASISSHVEWMHDAESIEFLTSNHEGVGAKFECVTKVGPIRLTDKIEVTQWLEGEMMGVRHDGLVSGTGEFRLSPVRGPNGSEHTRFEWNETLRFKWWMGGFATGWMARPVLKAIWRRNLRDFAARFS